MKKLLIAILIVHKAYRDLLLNFAFTSAFPTTANFSEPSRKPHNFLSNNKFLPNHLVYFTQLFYCNFSSDIFFFYYLHYCVKTTFWYTYYLHKNTLIKRAKAKELKKTLRQIPCQLSIFSTELNKIVLMSTQ